MQLLAQLVDDSLAAAGHIVLIQRIEIGAGIHQDAGVQACQIGGETACKLGVRIGDSLLLLFGEAAFARRARSIQGELGRTGDDFLHGLVAEHGGYRAGIHFEVARIDGAHAAHIDRAGIESCTHPFKCAGIEAECACQGGLIHGKDVLHIEGAALFAFQFLEGLTGEDIPFRICHLLLDDLRLLGLIA